jgi:hypothetical protein
MTMQMFVSMGALRRAGWAASVWLLCGCQSITEKLTEKAIEATIESQTGGEVDIDTSKQGAYSFKSKNDKGEEVVLDGQSGKVPDNWPKDIPAYPGAKVTASLLSGKNGMLMLETSDSTEKVLAFYKSNLGSMKEEANMNAGGTSIVTYEDKAAGRELAVGATAQDGKTMIHLQVSSKGQ